MKKVFFLILLLGLLLLGCQGAPQAEVPAPVATLPPASAPVPTAQPSVETLLITAMPATPSPTPPPTPTASPSPTFTPQPEATASPEPAATPFTIVWMSDTQHISRNNPDVFNAMRDWILDNREKENIQFVVHTGDVVDGYGTNMFENAANALVPIYEALPGMIVSGNHDVTKDGNPYFFSNQPYTQLILKPGQIYNDGPYIYACFVTFRAADTDFLVFGVGYDVVCTAWMNEVIAKHPNHVVITVVHKGLQETGEFSKQTLSMFRYVMPLWPNFRLVLCGHERGAQMRTEWFDDDEDGKSERSVTTMMFNYQEDRVKGLGFMRLLRFDPADHSIEVSTYSPWFDQWGYPKATEEENHFILRDAW